MIHNSEDFSDTNQLEEFVKSCLDVSLWEQSTTIKDSSTLSDNHLFGSLGNSNTNNENKTKSVTKSINENFDHLYGENLFTELFHPILEYKTQQTSTIEISSSTVSFDSFKHGM